MVLVFNQNHANYNVVRDSKSNKEDEEKLFNEDLDKEVKVNPKTMINA